MTTVIPSSPFAYGERVLLVDTKQRRYLVELKADGEFHSHAGFVPHADIVGRTQGTWLVSTKGAKYLALRPTLEDFVVEMPRGAQVIYPKDLANRARTNVRAFLGTDALERYDVSLRDSYEGIDPAHGPFDRVILDLPEPWQVVPHAEKAMALGGIILAYTPSI